jgi:hypothetical protein
MRFLNLALSFKFMETSTRIHCQVETPDSRVNRTAMLAMR